MRGAWVGTALAAVVLGGASPTPAAGVELKEVEARLTQAYRTCPGFKTAVDPEMLACIAAEYEVQDRRLNRAYARALAALSEKEKARLRLAQRAWLSYRDQWCGVTYDAESGSLERIAANECSLRETMLQTMRLEELANYGEAAR
jgi:uncharacterized protein YecT (DUF1311 family)